MGLPIFEINSKVISQLNASPWQIRETNARLGIGFLVMFFYLLIGAFVFVRIEGPAEQRDLNAYDEFWTYWTRVLTESGFESSQVDQLFADIRYMALKGIWREKNATSDRSWTFGRAFFFSGALISTVGYGKVSPKTQGGKFFTIIYCIIGIPLTLALLTAVVFRLKQPSAWLRGKLNARIGHLFHTGQIQVFHFLLVAGLLLIFVFIIPSYIFTKIEDQWTFLDAFYYCFVSLTTIGLGDYVPGDQPGQSFRAFYKMVVTVYLLLGLCCMMLFLATLHDMPWFNVNKFFLFKGDDYLDPDAKESDGTQKDSGPRYSHFEDESPIMPHASNGYYQSACTPPLR
ncbi:hypothetical protein AB6A40_007209 [Gnathostoma spinigerum]|uniref:Two pore potassium channel protein sup-9 n=1 Tax=Gnathostoma spinigerum TaxID=75299 RepID=A0ABD6ELS8_9BILA